MTDWQASHMQQVVNPSLFDPLDRQGSLGTASQTCFRRVQPARDRFAPSPSATAMPPTSVKHIGHSLRDGVDQPAVRELVTLLLRGKSQRCVDNHLDTLLSQGFPAEHIYLRLLQPAARHLGELWLEDICTFVDVTLATAVLQSGMRHLAPHFHQHGLPARGMRSVILATLDGDQHTFGLAMTAEFFRRSGWTVSMAASGDDDEIACQLRGERNAVVGLSMSRADQLPALSRVIRRLREPGRGRLAGILVGGPLFAGCPSLARETGADAVGLDARQALAEAESLASAGDDG